MSNVQGKKIYLALPYSHPDPYIREVRYRTATSVAASLMKRGAIVFSPITYGHQLCQYGIDTHFETWADIDRPMISWADEVWLLEVEGFDSSYGVRAELEYAMRLGKPVVRIAKKDTLINFNSHHVTPHNTPINAAASAMFPRIAEVCYAFTFKSKYKFGDSVFIVDDNNEIQEQEITEIAIAFIQGNQTLSFNGFHSKLVFSSYDEARKALEANFI